ncbi:MAG: ABC transporter permease subunit [Bacillota bacterium]|nr:ABC transporter permease subunit [Bacillota bacterium]
MTHIIRLTLKEIINKRIFHMGLILTAVYLLLYGTGLHYMVKDRVMTGDQFWYAQEVGYQFLTMGWYFSTFLSGALAILSGSGSISREIESGTILTLASRPISRKAIVTGKFLTYSAVTAVYSGILVAAITLLVIHYFKLLVDPMSLLSGIGLFMLMPVVLLAVAHLVSAIWSTLAAGVTAFMLYATATIGGFIEQMGALMNNPDIINVGIISSLIMPSDALYRLAVSIAGGKLGQGAIAFSPFGATSTPSTAMLIYALLYVVLILILAIHLFQKRDL